MNVKILISAKMMKSWQSRTTNALQRHRQLPVVSSEIPSLTPRLSNAKLGWSVIQMLSRNLMKKSMSVKTRQHRLKAVPSERNTLIKKLKVALSGLFAKNLKFWTQRLILVMKRRKLRKTVMLKDCILMLRLKSVKHSLSARQMNSLTRWTTYALI